MTRQIQQQVQQAETQSYVAVGNNQFIVGNSRGTLIVDGVLQDPVRIYEAVSTNGLSKYTAVEWVHPTTGDRRLSCNCPGWTIKKGPVRGCKHTDAMMQDPSLGMSLAEAQSALNAPTQIGGQVVPRRPLAPKTVEILEGHGQRARAINFGDE